MAQIARSYVAQVGLDTDRGGMPQPRLTDAMADAVSNVGRSIGQFADIAKIAAQKKKQKDDFKASTDYRRLQLSLGRQLQERADNPDFMPEDGEGFHDDYITNVYNPERQKFLAGLPSDELRERFGTLLADDGVDREEWSIKAAERQTSQTRSWALRTLGEGQQELANAISLNPEGYDKFLQQGFDDIDAAPNLNPAQIAEQKAAWERMAQVSHLNRMLESDPEAVLKSLGADPRYLSPSTQYDMLERAIIGQESGGNASAVSPKGAIGLMQVMPGTALEISKELKDGLLDSRMSDDRIKSILSNEVTNRRYGRYYLRKQIQAFGKQGGLEAALIAYNGGPERAKKWIASGFDDSVLPKETANYYKEVMARLPGAKPAGKGDPKSVQIEFNRPKGMAALAGQSEEKLNPDLVDRVKTSFAALGLQRVKVTSGFRSEADNRRVGGAKKSQHIHGNAMDIDVSGYSIPERQQIIQTLSANGITGLGIGTNIIHADLGGRRAWGYKGPSGGGAVPKWAQAVIDDHLAGKSAAPARLNPGIDGRYASLSYDDRQSFIHKADQVVTQRFNTASKENAVLRVSTREAMQNELASLANTGVSTGFDDTQVATVLGEDDYMKYARDKNVAQRMYSARQGIEQMSLAEMNDRVEDYKADPGSATFADDNKIATAVQREVDRVTNMRAKDPSKAALLYPDVKKAYDSVQQGMQQGNLDPEQVQDFVRLTLERQKEFNLKPGSEAPVPKEWAMEIGRSLSRIPEISREMKITDVNAAILIQYQELQKIFGDYTDEVILHALSEYNGVSKNTSDLVTGYMQAIQQGGDPLRLMRTRDRASDQDQQEQVTDDGWWSSIKRNVSEFWSGEPQPDEEDTDPGDPELPSSARMKVLGLSSQEQHLYEHHVNNLRSGKAVKNADGSTSTVYQISVERNGKVYNIPTVWDGKIVSAKEAMKRAGQQGWDKWPSYDSEEEAAARYDAMHTPMEADISASEEEAAPSNEVILRVIGQLNGATPEDEADIAARYGQRAYEAAKRRIEGGQQ